MRMSCPTGPLRVGRSLRDAYTGRVRNIFYGPADGRRNLPSEQREAPCSPPRNDRYTHHEVVARRAGGPSGRT